MRFTRQAKGPLLRACNAVLSLAACLALAAPLAAGPIHKASRDGDLATVQEQIAAGVDIDEVEPMFGTPLMLAALRGNVEIVETLLAEGADPEIMTTYSNDKPMSALHLAARFGRPGTAKALLDAGVDPDIGDRDAGELPLHVAAHFNKPEVIQLLLDRGATIDAQVGEHAYTPLHEAAKSGGVAGIELLIAQGAEVNAADADGNTPAHVAAQFDAAASFDPLVAQGADLALTNAADATPLAVARANGHDEVIAVLEGMNAPE